MVAKGSTGQATKRKKTEEMADSPPKRVTRARKAKATDNVELASNDKKPAKVPAKVAAEKKKAPVKASTAQKKTSATKPKTQADDEIDVLDDKSTPKLETEEESKPKPASLRGGCNKMQEPQKEAEPEVVDAPKPRGRHVKAASAKSAKATVSTSRDKAKKEKKNEPAIEQQDAEPVQAVEPVRKVTRGRAAATTNGTTTNIAPKATTRARTTKKVQFQEEAEKENAPLEKEAPKKAVKSIMKPTGIRAKPVRKPTATRITTRGRKAVEDQAEGEQDQFPLSPKKVNQVAKAGSASSEDELAGEKTTIRSPSKSSNAFQTSPVRIMNTITTPVSLSKSSSAGNILSSPARRPPPSPFKDGLRISPKKVDINFSNEDSIFQSTLNKTPVKSSLLQESPKKMILQTSAACPALASMQPPLKSSLLQSPARRPVTSPFKSPKKLGSEYSSKLVNPIQLPNPPKPIRFSPQQAASSPLRAAKSPEQMLHVHKITPKGQEAPPIFKIPSPGMADSPGKSVPSDAAMSEAIGNVDADTTMQDVDSIAPCGYQEVPTNTSSSAFTIPNEASRRDSMESGSTDELASPDKIYAPTPLKKADKFSQDFATPTTAARAAVTEVSNEVSFTPLVGKLDSWSASSPNDRDIVKPPRGSRGMFSLGEAAAAALKEESLLEFASPIKTSFFEDELAVMDEELKQAQEVIDRGAEVTLDGKAARAAMQAGMESQASEEYGDENTAPTEAEVLREEQDNDVPRTCTPAKVFTSMKVTPVQKFARHPVETFTVSRVPLRASAEDSALKVTRQRSKSVGGLFSALHEPSILTEVAAAELPPIQPETPKLEATVVPQTQSSGMKLDAETPGRTIRKGAVPDVLKGAIVYVDVHTTEGADASSIFVDLLTQMGARCVKQWNWNPRASMVSSLDNTASQIDDPPNASQSASRIGITHVVYKDGGQRTLQKVRQSHGVVLCVGVGWVLDCEREDRWLDEADYAIDTTIVPRGGGRRRKSMEPRALANMAGNLVSASSETAQTPAKNTISPTEEFLTFNTPASRRETFIIEPQVETVVGNAPTTPLIAFAQDDGIMEDDDEPATPYYLSKNAQLIQRTCPPKQAGQVLSLISGDENDHVKRKLLEARRKSMAFVSKTRSPLGRTVSYGGGKGT